jgi:hypothetical protein
VGVFPTEEKVEEEVLRGPQVTSSEERNPDQGKPQCI